MRAVHSRVRIAIIKVALLKSRITVTAAIGYMLTAVFLFSIVDVLAKSLAETYPVNQIVFLGCYLASSLL